MTLPNHLFVSHDGNLYDTRQDDWAKKPVRRNYSQNSLFLESASDVKAALRAGPYAWPGGYQLAFVMSDGGLICYDCARTNLFQILWSLRDDICDGWHPYGVTILDHLEDENHTCCDNCNKSFDD